MEFLIKPGEKIISITENGNLHIQRCSRRQIWSYESVSGKISKISSATSGKGDSVHEELIWNSCFIQWKVLISLWCRGVVAAQRKAVADSCVSYLDSIPTSASWEVTMMRLLDDGSFWKYGFWLFLGQSSHKNNFSPSIFFKRLFEFSQLLFWLRFLYHQRSLSYLFT